MRKKAVLVLFTVVSLLLLSSCDTVFGIMNDLTVTEEELAQSRMEQVVSALKDNDKDALKSLFSPKAINEADDFDGGVDLLFDYIQGTINSYEYLHHGSVHESMEYGKRSMMFYPRFTIKTDVEEYKIILVDYPTDTIDPDNEGVYMLEIHKTSYDGEWKDWEDRLCAGVSIVE